MLKFPFQKSIQVSQFKDKGEVEHNINSMGGTQIWQKNHPRGKYCPSRIDLGIISENACQELFSLRFYPMYNLTS